MSETKPTTRRRAVTIPKHEEVNSEYEVSVENTPSEAVPTESTQEETIPVNTDVPAITENDFPDPITDDEWEKQIAAAHAEKAGAPAVRASDNNNAEIAQKQRDKKIENQTNDIIEQEVKRRVALELQKQSTTTQEASTQTPPNVTNELTEEKKNEIAEKNDCSVFVHMSLGDDTDFIDAFEREMNEDERPDSDKQSDPTAYAAGMAATRQLGQTNNQQRLLMRWLGAIYEKNTNALKAVEKEMRLARITPKIGDGSGPKKLTGATARAAVVSRMKGMYRVQLYNSGFWLDLRPPTLIDIDSWMQSIDTEFKELGRVLGGHAHTIIDVFIKQKFFDILPGLVQRSNFEEYNDPNKLVSNISYHDYDTLLWALCCMMYKDGIGAGIYCTNPDCRHIDEHQYIDLKNICFLNTEIFNDRAKEWMTRGAHAGSKLLTENDLKQYREEVLGFKKIKSYDNGLTSYEFKVPTIKEFIDESSALVSKMERLLNGKHDITTDIVSNQITFHLYKMLTPWIKTLSMYDDKGNLQYQIPDREAIYDSLDVDHLENSDIYDDATNFIRDTKISFYSATTLKCPKCGKVADMQHDNMFPLDMQYLFFCLSCHMLQQTGASY